MKRLCPELHLRADWEKSKKSINTHEVSKLSTGDGSAEVYSRAPGDGGGNHAFSIPAQRTAAYSLYRTSQHGHPYTSNPATQGAVHILPTIWESMYYRPSATSEAPFCCSHTTSRAPAQRPTTSSRAVVRHILTAPGASAHLREATDHSTNTTPGPQTYDHTALVSTASANHSWIECVVVSNTYSAAPSMLHRE